MPNMRRNVRLEWDESEKVAPWAASVRDEPASRSSPATSCPRSRSLPRSYRPAGSCSCHRNRSASPWHRRIRTRLS